MKWSDLLPKLGTLTPEILAKIIKLHNDGEINRNGADRLIKYYVQMEGVDWNKVNKSMGEWVEHISAHV